MQKTWDGASKQHLWTLREVWLWCVEGKVLQHWRVLQQFGIVL